MQRLFKLQAIALTFSVLLLQPLSTLAQAPDELQPLTKSIELFTGNDFAGWIFYCSKGNGTKLTDVWKVEDGIMKCSGRPAGYLQTKAWYRDYQLELKWRWPSGKGGNSGILVHTTTPQIFYNWPRSVEVQLQSGSAGDFWVIGNGVDIRVPDQDQRRAKPVKGDLHTHRRIRRLEGKYESAVGQWNTMKILCSGGHVSVFVNDRLVNEGTDSTENQGAIALQSEGTPIEFKDIRLSPLKKSRDQ